MLMYQLVRDETWSTIPVLTRHAGTTFSAIHFVPGQFVDVAAKSYVIIIPEQSLGYSEAFTGSAKVSRVR